jgi:hypothetical protein
LGSDFGDHDNLADFDDPDDIANVINLDITVYHSPISQGSCCLIKRSVHKVQVYL